MIERATGGTRSADFAKNCAILAVLARFGVVARFKRLSKNRDYSMISLRGVAAVESGLNDRLGRFRPIYHGERS